MGDEFPPIKRLSLYDRAHAKRGRKAPVASATGLGQPGNAKPWIRSIPAGEQTEPTVSIVIPAKNEARNLPDVLARLPEGCEVILVDGDSTDDTIKVAHQLSQDITVIGQTRQGKGNALACGFATAKGDFIVMIDADGSNDPAEIPRFVAR